MNVEISMVSGWGELLDADDVALSDACSGLPPLEMPQPPLVGDFVEWEIERDGSVAFLTARVTVRRFHFNYRRRTVTCRLDVELCGDEDFK